MPRNKNRFKQRTVEVSADELYSRAGFYWYPRTYKHNIDFSDFIDALKLAYNEMQFAYLKVKSEEQYSDDDSDDEYEIHTLLPFCVFQHCMVSRLNAHIIGYLQEQGSQYRLQELGSPHDLFQFPKFPLIVYEYLASISNATRADGDLIQLNIPPDAVPKSALTNPDVGPGTFGKITSENHNLYECYISPYVTRRFIEESVKGPARTDWNPFPEGFHPKGTLTENLLGYQKLEFISEYYNLQNRIRRIRFSESDYLRGRLAFSDEVESMVDSFLKRISDKIIVKEGFPPLTQKNTIEYFRLEAITWDDRRHYNDITRTQNYYRTPPPGVLVLKRRNHAEPGLCIIPSEEEVKSAFLEHINDNFDCNGVFGFTDLKKYYGLEENTSALVFSVNCNLLRESFCNRVRTPHFPYAAHNIDFSGFVNVLKAAYLQYDRVEGGRYLPYPVFQHCMVSRLNAHIIGYLQHSQYRLQELGSPHDLFQFPKFPLIVYEYLSSIRNATTVGGDLIQLNIPPDAVPKSALTNPNVGPGTFGKITPENHNLYECYISPYVTRRLIEESVKGPAGTDWNPFPEGFHPKGTLTENLLGYQQRQARLSYHYENIKFPESNNLIGRLAFSSDVENMVDRFLERISDKIIVKEGFPPFTPTNSIRYFRQNAVIHEDRLRYNFIPGTEQHAQAPPGFLVLGRREKKKPGLCIIPSEEEVKSAFLEHINDNFDCIGPFAKVRNTICEKNYLLQREYFWATIFEKKPLSRRSK